MQIKASVFRTSVDSTSVGTGYEMELRVDSGDNSPNKISTKCNGSIIVRSDKPFDPSLVAGSSTVTITLADKADGPTA